MHTHLDSALIIQWARRAMTGLKNEQAQINSLNVFPIPDSDTGTNMALTMEAAVSNVDEVLSKNSDAHADLVTVATALAQGAVRGARGSSGLVFSQFLRAVAEASLHGPIDGMKLAQMLSKGADFARAALSNPVEGTVITVLDNTARVAAQTAETTTSLAEVVDAAVEEAKTALQKTTNQLDALKTAGVVDAGAYGFVLLLSALQDVLGGAAELESMPSHAAAGNHEVEVMFGFVVEDVAHRDELFRVMEEYGNSVVVGTVTDTEFTMHVHTAQAGLIIERAFGLGRVFNLRIEVLPEVAEDDQPQVPQLPIIAVCPADTAATGVQELFEKFGARVVVSGDDGSDVLAASTEKTMVLTNGQDVTGMKNTTTDHVLEFIDTGSVVGGLAAIAVFDDTAEWEDTVDDILSAVSTQRTLSVTEAELAEVGASGLTTAIQQLLGDDGELVTVLWDGDGEIQQAVDSMIEMLVQVGPGVEVQQIHTTGLGVAIEVGVE